MTRRERFIQYVKNGGEEPFVSLQIGAGAGFDAKLAGREWISEGGLDDILKAYDEVGGDALINIGLPDLGAMVPALQWKHETERTDDIRVTHRWLQTPYGEMRYEFREKKKAGSTPIQSPIQVGGNLDMVFWYADQHEKALPYVAEAVGPTLEQLHPEWPVSIQWALQPFELFGLAAVPDLVMLAMTEPERYRKVCDHIRDVNIELLREVFKAGADFVFLGGPGREMMSPKLYEEYMVPDSQKITAAVHEAGGLVYSHICSPIEPFLTQGYYSQMGIDLFETLSPPPVGNVEDLAEARRILPEEMCTRGNVGLDILLNGTVEDVEKATLDVLEATKGYKHMVAASDYLFYDIPLENARAVVRTVENYGK